MTDNEIISRIESRLTDPPEDGPHHPECLWWEDYDPTEYTECTCAELREADRITAAEAKLDAEREG